MASVSAAENSTSASEFALGSSSASNPTAWNTACAEKWNGGVHQVLQCNVAAAWSLQSDFLGLPKWANTVGECLLLEGEANAVGCLRYCKGNTNTTLWVHERLLELDDANRYMSYRMEDNHFVFPQGFQGYVAKVQLGEAGEGQTWVRWTYEVNPVISATREYVTQFMFDFYSASLKFLEAGANKLVAENRKASTPRAPAESTERTAGPDRDSASMIAIAPL